MYKVDIDTGGTMTDGLVSGNGKLIAMKVETTPHDLTLSFLDTLKAAQESLGYEDLRTFLAEVEVIRWSSTITSNVLAQRVGPKIGLLVTAGHEKDLYDQAAADAVLGVLIQPEDIQGIEPNTDETTVRKTIKSLLDRGIRRINVSLKDSFPDTSQETRVIDMISEDYPDHFLGSIPALAGSEVVLRSDDATRTVASLINTYVHPSLASTLYRAEEAVRVEYGWQGNVLIGHLYGGVARIGKTRAFDTIESGPIFGTHACAAAGEKAGDGKVIAIDVGGTTAKVSAVEDGEVVFKEEGDLFDIPIKLDFPLLRSIALGGGSVARVKDGRVVIGPDSMGAAPGPAAYGLGGRNATITDAFVVSGFVEPTGFLDGKRELDVERARKVIDRHVAQPLNLSIDEAARAIVEQAWDDVAQLARETAEEVGWDPSETTVYAYGGNGPLFVTAVADRLGAKNARFFKYGNVYSAYGSAISEVVHVYETGVTEAIPTHARKLLDNAILDLRGEGFDGSKATFEWTIANPDGRASGEPTNAEGAVGGASALAAGLEKSPTLIQLRTSYPLPGLEVPQLESGNEVPAPYSERTSSYGNGGVLPAYYSDDLTQAHIQGPLLVDGGSYTWLITDGWDLAINPEGDGVLSKKSVSVTA